MEIEAQGFYPDRKQQKGQIRGSAHVYIPEWDLDIRGIVVIIRKDRVFVRPPHSRGWDPEERKMIMFPVFSFTSKERKKDFIESLQSEIKRLLSEEGLFKGKKCK